MATNARTRQWYFWGGRAAVATPECAKRPPPQQKRVVLNGCVLKLTYLALCDAERRLKKLMCPKTRAGGLRGLPVAAAVFEEATPKKSLSDLSRRHFVGV